jgi:NADH:ubiquinone oxidoreductase subunit K
MSFSWLDFFIFFLWINFFGFIISFSNLINLLLLCELFWIIFFIYFSVLSVYYNSVIIFLVSIYILCIATGETTIGLSLLILKSTIFGSLNNYNLISNKNTKFFNKLKNNIINSKILKKWKK